MRNFILYVTQTFSAAHFIRGYEGKCKNMHGHNWKVEVILKSNKLNEIGMVKDFKEIKNKLNTILKEFDHTILNDHEKFQEGQLNPTCENIAYYIYHKINCKDFDVYSVKVYENENSCAEYSS